MEKTAFTPLDLARLCRDLADNKKADKIAVLDLRGLSSICDYYVICNGTSEPHLRAIATEIEVKLKELGHRARGREGVYSSNWVIIDYYDVLVHIFHPETRAHYALDQLWGDAPRVK